MLKQLYNLNFEREFYLTAAVELMCKKLPASFEDRRMKGKKEQVKYLRTISEDVHSCEVAWKPQKLTSSEPITVFLLIQNIFT